MAERSVVRDKGVACHGSIGKTNLRAQVFKVLRYHSWHIACFLLAFAFIVIAWAMAGYVPRQQQQPVGHCGKTGKEPDAWGAKYAKYNELFARFAAMETAKTQPRAAKDVSEILADTMTNGKGKGKDGKGKDKDKGKGKDKGKDGKGKDKGKGKDRQGKGGGGAKDRSCQRTWKLILGNTVRKCYTFQFPKVFLKL